MSWRKLTSFFVAACITMPKAPPGVKRPRDTNQLAKLIVDNATGQIEDRRLSTRHEYFADRLSFLKTGAIGSTALVAGAALAEEALAAGSIPQGDVDILRLLAAAESSRPISGCNLTSFAEFSIRKNRARAGIRASSHR